MRLTRLMLFRRSTVRVLTITFKEDKLSQSYESPLHKMYFSVRQLVLDGLGDGEGPTAISCRRDNHAWVCLYIHNGAAGCALEQFPCIAMSDCNVPHVINGQIALYPCRLLGGRVLHEPGYEVISRSTPTS